MRRCRRRRLRSILMIIQRVEEHRLLSNSVARYICSERQEQKREKKSRGSITAITSVTKVAGAERQKEPNTKMTHSKDR